MDVASQRPILDGVVKQGVSGLAVSVIDPKEQTPDLTRIAKKVPLITMDNDAEQTGRLCYVGIDNYEAGKAVGRMVKKALPDGGTVALFIGGTTRPTPRPASAACWTSWPGRRGRSGTTLGKFQYYRGEPLTDGGDETAARRTPRTVLEDLKGAPDLCWSGCTPTTRRPSSWPRGPRSSWAR